MIQRSPNYTRSGFHLRSITYQDLQPGHRSRRRHTTVVAHVMAKTPPWTDCIHARKHDVYLPLHIYHTEKTYDCPPLHSAAAFLSIPLSAPNATASTILSGTLRNGKWPE